MSVQVASGQDSKLAPLGGGDGRVARDLSYAHGAATRGGRVVIRSMENLLGRPSLIRRVSGYDADVRAGQNFWSVISERFGLELEVVRGSLADIPVEGPLIVIANHPFGVLDGLMLGHILQKRRGDFRILAHNVFHKVPDLDRVILPIDFAETPEALATNLVTRKEALRYLGEGGAIGIFPGGTVSTGARMFTRPMDPVWRGFTARMIARSGAAVVPIYFEGHTSRLFQIASHLHATLRMGLLLREFRIRADTPVRISVGKAVPREELDARAGNSKAMMDFLRKATYELSPEPLHSYDYGYEFEAKHRA